MINEIKISTRRDKLEIDMISCSQILFGNKKSKDWVSRNANNLDALNKGISSRKDVRSIPSPLNNIPLLSE
jgi:hypothetical protein